MNNDDKEPIEEPEKLLEEGDEQPLLEETTEPDAPAVSDEPVGADSSTEVPESNPIVSTGPNEPVSDVTPTPAPKKKFPVLIAVIIAGALVILGGGSAAAYNLYYQNPEKVLGDALATTLQAKTATYTGTVDVKTDDVTLKVTFDGKSASAQSGEINVTADIKAGTTTLKAKGSGLTDSDGNLYFKLQNVQELVDSLLASVGSDTVDTSAFTDIIAKLENKWIKISADDLKDYSKEYSDSQTCINNALKSFNTDDAAKKEISTAYKDNQFLVIDKKLGSKTINGVGSLGYAIKADDGKAEAFSKALENTKIGKEFKACAPDSVSKDVEETNVDEDKTVTNVELWVSRFGHNITQLNVTSTEGSDTFKATINPIFNKTVTVSAPTDTTTLKQIAEDITKAYTDYYMSQYSSSYGIDN